MVTIKNFISFLICITVLLQGGFYYRSHIFLGAISALVVIFLCSKIPFKPETFLLAGISLIYILSAIFTGFSIDVLARSVQPVIIFMYWLIIHNLNFESRLNILKNIFIFSILISFVSISSYIGLFHIDGNEAANRLQFTFQYANAAGIFFAAIALAMHYYKKEKWYNFIPALEVALLLTQSIGAIFSYILGLVFSFYLKLKRQTEPKETLKESLIQLLLRLIISITISVIVYIIKLKTSLYLLPIAVVILLFIVCINQKKIIDFITKHNIHKPIFIVALISSFLVFFTQRWMRGTLTFIERIIQITDSFEALKRNSVFGLGPGNWELVKSYWQTAEYSANIIHSSFMQIAADAGIFALALVISLIILFALKIKESNPSFASSIFAILLHSTLDFSLSFLSINLLLILLYSCMCISDCSKEIKKIYFIVPATMLLIVLGFLIWGQVQIDKAKAYTNSGNYIQSNLILEKNPFLLKNSYRNQMIYIVNLYHMKQYEQALNKLKELPHNTPEKIYMEAAILEKTGKHDLAAYKLLEGIELMPYQTVLHEYLQELINTKISSNIKEDIMKRYDQISKMALKKQHWLAVFLPQN